MKALYYFFVLSILFSSSYQSLASNNTIAEITQPAQLKKMLQQGGYIVFVRHGQTSHAKADGDIIDLSSCEKQRNLSTKGIVELKNIAKIIRSLKIPIAAVYSSPFCRCKDTAKILFGHYEVKQTLQFSFRKSQLAAKLLARQLKEMMLTAQPQQKNIFFVSHTANLRDSLNIWPKPEGVMVIFKKHQQGLRYIGKISPNQW
ncbi:MAG: histidine phosphatase family protein [Psychrobium sp.]|nr:histidine phosphatase family protein [Psychrobium sp.]